MLARPLDAPAVGHVLRGHRGIENRVSWVLDVAFPEDQCRIRPGHAAENFGTPRRLGLTLLQRGPTKRNPSIRMR